MKKRYLPLLFGVFLLSSCSIGIQSTTEVEKIVTIADEVDVIQIKNSIADVYAKAKKSCVGIMAKEDDGVGTGSGVIYKYDSAKDLYYVVTNAHVVRDSKDLSVYDGESIYYKATLVGKDTKNDVAVITFTTDVLGENREFEVNSFMTQENSDMITVGQTALAIGCPLDLVENYNSLSVGVVSGIEDLKIVTDAALNPGNSGGGLFNMDGRMIGLINSKTMYTTQVENGVTQQVPVEGRGYAISMPVVKKCIKDIEELGGEITRPVFGMYVTSINTLVGGTAYEQWKEYLPEGEAQYAYVITTGFNDNSQAKECGVQEGDVILKINDKDVHRNDDISSVLYLARTTDTVKLTVYRQSEKKVVEINVTWTK